MSAVGVHHVVVGARDLETALRLYRDHLGLGVRRGPETVPAAELALWGLPPEADSPTAVTLGSPDQQYGLIRLVTFGECTGEPVRKDARPYDYSPKNLDFQTNDLARAYQTLSELGYVFRSEPVVYPHDGHWIKEVQLRGPDEVNVVLLETEAGMNLPFSPRGFAGVTQWVLTVGDLGRAVRLFSEGLGIPVALHNRLAGPDIERMIGLPPGAGLDITILAGTTPFGRIELVHYEGVDSRDFTPRARPPASGMLQVGFVVDDLDATLDRLAAFGAQPLCPPTTVPDPVGRLGRAASVVDPTGLMIELWQR
jgi:catechol 2,3-dioxygenase-like lactoylglutathione lyase family enzyme